jgi:hypothetical protein
MQLWTGRLLSSAWAISGLVSSAAATAGDFSSHALLEDTQLYFTAPLHWDRSNWMEFGEAVVEIGIAHEFDDEVRAHFVNGPHAVAGGSDPNNLKEAAPAFAIVAATWTAALLMKDDAGYREGWSMLEAAGFSAVSASMLKLAFGRERPNVTASVDSWFQGGESFPSGHTTFAFAVGTVLAESGNDDYRWVRRALGYGIGAATAYLRVRDNVHWLSDTVAGAALGISTADFVMKRHEPRERHASLQLLPTDGGLMLSLSEPLR